MFKKISTDQVEVGMYIHDLDAAWLQHPFFRNRFHVNDGETIEKIRKLGLKHVIIDTEKGLGASAGIPQADVQRRLEEQCEQIADSESGLEKQVPVAEEIDKITVLR